MERSMEVGVDLLQEEARRTQCVFNAQLTLDRKLRRLQWVVAGCSISLLVLMGLTFYQMLGNASSPESDKLETSSQRSGSQQNTKPRAHLTGTSQEGSKDRILRWESNNGLAFVEDGMKYINKSLQIPKQGYYFVYCHVSIKIPPNFGDSFESEVMRKNDNYNDGETLFSGKALHNGQQTIYLAGLVHLKTGDLLTVMVSKPKEVEIRLSQKTFFGAFWVMDVPRSS